MSKICDFFVEEGCSDRRGKRKRARGHAQMHEFDQFLFFFASIMCLT